MACKQCFSIQAAAIVLRRDPLDVLRWIKQRNLEARQFGSWNSSQISRDSLIRFCITYGVPMRSLDPPLTKSQSHVRRRNHSSTVRSRHLRDARVCRGGVANAAG